MDTQLSKQQPFTAALDYHIRFISLFPSFQQSGKKPLPIQHGLSTSRRTSTPSHLSFPTMRYLQSLNLALGSEFPKGAVPPCRLLSLPSHWSANNNHKGGASLQQKRTSTPSRPFFLPFFLSSNQTLGSRASMTTPIILLPRKQLNVIELQFVRLVFLSLTAKQSSCLYRFYYLSHGIFHPLHFFHSRLLLLRSIGFSSFIRQWNIRYQDTGTPEVSRTMDHVARHPTFGIRRHWFTCFHMLSHAFALTIEVLPHLLSLSLSLSFHCFLQLSTAVTVLPTTRSRDRSQRSRLQYGNSGGRI